MPIYTGAAEHHLNDGSKRRFTPSGPMYLVPGRDVGRSRRRRRASEDVQDYSVGLSARLFVGLSVGQTPKHTIEQVVTATRYWRERHDVPVDSSFIAQKGLYTQDDKVVEENSAQIIIIDLQELTVDKFTSEIVGLAAYLRTKFEQKSVIVEIQKAGVIQRVLNVTAETKQA